MASPSGSLLLRPPLVITTSPSPSHLMLHHTVNQQPDGQHHDDHRSEQQTWTPVLLSPRPPPSPPAPIPIPSPAPGARGLPDVDPDLESGAGGAHTALHNDADADANDDVYDRRLGRRSFVGGLINGLKRLPKALTKSYHPNERKTDRSSDSLEYASSHRQSHNTAPLSPTNEPHPLTSPTLQASDPQPQMTTTTTTLPFHDSRTPSNSSLSTTPTPVYIEPKPTSDYAEMDPPPSSEPSLASYLTRLRQFLKAINDLPWIAPRSTVDYVPGQFSGSHPVRSRRETHLSWYAAAAAPHHSLDLLSSGSLAGGPDSSATLVYQPQRYNSTPGKHARSQSVQFCAPSVANVLSDPILRPPPPAWTS